MTVTLPRAQLLRSGPSPVAWELAVSAHLYSHATRAEPSERIAALKIARVTGPAIVLGRFQSPHNVVDLAACGREGVPVYRRMTGGKAFYCGGESILLSLVLPHVSSLLRESAPISASKVLNRHVRGILPGLQGLGIRAFYFGRDFLTVERKQAGYLSFEIDPSGVVLFEAWIAVQKPFAVPAALSTAPPRSSSAHREPPIDSLASASGRDLDPEVVADALERGFRGRPGLALEPISLRDIERRRIEGTLESRFAPVREEGGREDFGHSASKEIPIGFVQVAVSLEQGKFLKKVRLSGDFIVSSSAVDRLERELRLCPVRWRDIGLVVDRVFGDPESGLIGLKSLRVIADSIYEAAQNAQGNKAGQ